MVSYHLKRKDHDAEHQPLDRELAELLQFLADWLASDHDQLVYVPGPLRRQPRIQRRDAPRRPRTVRVPARRNESEGRLDPGSGCRTRYRQMSSSLPRGLARPPRQMPMTVCAACPVLHRPPRHPAPGAVCAGEPQQGLAAVPRRRARASAVPASAGRARYPGRKGRPEVTHRCAGRYDASLRAV